MKIAIIGWGSLIWCQKGLRLVSKWKKNGPKLPIEFSRISKCDRLTLVIDPDGTEVITYWAESPFKYLKKARENLKAREGADKIDAIHFIIRNGKVHKEVCEGVRNIMIKWLNNKRSIDAVIWTGLKSNWCKERRRAFSSKDAIDYLKDLKKRKKEKLAKEYITMAPRQINTSLRRRIRKDLHWTDIRLSANLFEP